MFAFMFLALASKLTEGTEVIGIDDGMKVRGGLEEEEFVGRNLKCILELAQIISSLGNIFDPTKDKPTEMAMASGIKINNLGSYDNCNKIDGARYTIYREAVNAVISLCAPEICSKQDLADFFNGNLTHGFALTAPTGLQAKNFYFPKDIYEDECTTLSTGAWAMITFIIIMGVIVCFGTALDLLKVFNKGITLPDSLGIRCLLCFSAYTNLIKLFENRQPENGQKDTLDILNGVRVMSIGWVILGHITQFYFTAVVLSNYADLPDILRESNKMLLYGGVFAVDSFFWLSGLLMSYLFIKELNSPRSMGAKEFGLVYLHRYIRITPLVLFCTLLWWSLQAYVGDDSPVWFDYKEISADCPDYWWTNILYLNNFIPDFKSSACLGQTWYLSCDMQFFLFSPLILYAYHKTKIGGWALFVGIVSLSIIFSGIIASHYDLNVSILSSNNGSEYFDYYYNKPYTRMGAYAIGLAMGVLLYSHRLYKSSGQVYDLISVKIGEFYERFPVRVASFILGMFFINFFIFYPYDTYKHPGDSFDFESWGQDANVVFIAFKRVMYTLGLTLVLLPSLLGHFPFITMILGASFWNPFAKLTFAVYLMHINIIFTSLATQHTQIYFSEFDLVRDLVYYSLISFALCIPVVLLIEAPFINLEKVLLRPKPRAQLTEKQQAVDQSLKPLD